MRLDDLAQMACQAFLSGGTQMGGLVESLLCFLRELSNSAADLQELRFGVAYQFHEDFALPSALAAKVAHDLLQVVLKLLGLRLERGDSCGALLGDVVDEVEDFF